MTTLFSFIWAPNPEIVEVLTYSIRWYGLLFASGFIIGQQLMFKVYKAEGLEQKYVEELTFFMIFATVLGARLGHVFFYEPMRYLSDPLQILNIRGGGLASHGAGVGIFIGIYLYRHYDVRIGIFPPKFSVKKELKKNQSWLWLADRIVLVVALSGALIRFGNFVNSEIIGKPTATDYGVVFAWDAKNYLEYGEKVIDEVSVYANKQYEEEVVPGYTPMIVEIKLVKADYPESSVRKYIEQNVRANMQNYKAIRDHVVLPDTGEMQYELFQKNGQYHARIEALGINRHPAQLYESISCLILFFFLLWLWNRKKAQVPRGSLFGIFLIYIFGLRFVYEFLKENQVAFEENLPLNMGQWLSIPMVIAGIIILIRAKTPQTKN